jgi:DNA-binding IclR family transcriptional regulator
VRQKQPSGRYGIGPLAAELGFAALRNMDVVELAQDTLDDLRDQLQTVTSLTIWANRGPTIVRRSVHEQSVSLVVQLGAVMSMLTSANGRVFLAFAPKEMTAPLIAAELRERGGLAARAGLRTMSDVTALQDKVRAQGFATVIGTMHHGIAAASAPIFDYTGKIVAALTLVGLDGVIDLNPKGRPIRTLLELSSQMGFARVEVSQKAVAMRTPARRLDSQRQGRARALRKIPVT